MNSLTKYTLFEIFSFLSGKDLAKGPLRVCKKFRTIIKGFEYLLGTITKNSLNLLYDYRIDYALFQQIFNKIYSSAPDDLNFKGFATTGGYYGDNIHYWVGNLYKGDQTYYCSKIGKINFNTVGVLENALSLEQVEAEDCEYISRILREIKDISSYLKPRFLGNKVLSSAAKRDFYLFFISNRDEIIHTVSESFNEPLQVVEEKLMKEIEGMEVEKTDPVKISEDYVLQDSINTALADKSKTKAVITHVSVNRQGSFTCPVKTFIVLCSEEFIDLESEEFVCYNDMLTFEKLQSAFPGEISKLIRAKGSIYCTFNRSKKSLKPLAWGNFFSPDLNDIMTITIPNNTIANYLYFKKIWDYNSVVSQ